jgi:hypothetical protein
MSALLELNCLVLGDDPSLIFTVEIANIKSVSTLKKAIKDENNHTFQHVDTRSFELYHISFFPDDIEAHLKHFRPIHDPKNAIHCLSQPMKELKDILGCFNHGFLHVIMQHLPAGECQICGLL